MSSAPSLGIPELAGLCTYAEASRIGFSVDENVRRLLRFHWVERRLMEIAVAHLTSIPEWEVKCALALHQWQDAEHAEALRRRITEMRNPAPRMDEAPDARLDEFLDEVMRARDTMDLLTGVYSVLRTELANSYTRHIGATNSLVDHPTRRLMRFARLEHEEALAWSSAALEALLRTDDAARARSREWAEYLRSRLTEVGGLAGDRVEETEGYRTESEVGIRSDGSAGGPPNSQPNVEFTSARHQIRATHTDSSQRRRADPSLHHRSSEPFTHDFYPRRDARFAGLYNFSFPPHLVYNAPGVSADERNLALLCKRTLEMDVPEMMASFIIERREQPWEFYLDYSRQLWDEARHAMMGTVAFESRGVDWTRIPLNIGFALRLNGHATALERQIMLFAIEQSLMAGKTGKRFEYETALAAGDALSAHFHDYDWADETLHAQIGRRWLKREGITATQAAERTREIHDRTWAALDRYKYRDAQQNWWRDFVRSVLNKESSVREEELGEPRIISE